MDITTCKNFKTTLMTHPDISSTLELEQNSSHSFLDILVERKPDFILEHNIYRRYVHTNRYLVDAESHCPKTRYRQHVTASSMNH